MTVILFRHGPAESRSRGGDDESRRLTADGRRRTRAAARGLRRLGPVPRAVVSSPLARARQTAEILAEVLGGRRRVRLSDALRPEAAPAEADALLRDLGSGPATLVGHEPHLSTLARCWLGCRGGVALKKAGALCLETREPPEGSASLLWLATPRMLRRIGEG
ncbi:MAG: histidine phosphatase family protein [Planctomycetales bacterium]|nr:histidine phosphatase family protein [Planctomycetales bacterium]